MLRVRCDIVAVLGETPRHSRNWVGRVRSEGQNGKQVLNYHGKAKKASFQSKGRGRITILYPKGRRDTKTKVRKRNIYRIRGETQGGERNFKKEKIRKGERFVCVTKN